MPEHFFDQFEAPPPANNNDFANSGIANDNNPELAPSNARRIAAEYLSDSEIRKIIGNQEKYTAKELASYFKAVKIEAKKRGIDTTSEV